MGYESVRLTRELIAGGYDMRKGTGRTVVAVCDKGATYGIEIADLTGGADNVKLSAARVERVG